MITHIQALTNVPMVTVMPDSNYKLVELPKTHQTLGFSPPCEPGQ